MKVEALRAKPVNNLTVWIISMPILTCRGLVGDVGGSFLCWPVRGQCRENNKKICAFRLTALSEARNLWLVREWSAWKRKRLT
jgi:hypothetical protein